MEGFFRWHDFISSFIDKERKLQLPNKKKPMINKKGIIFIK